MRTAANTAGSAAGSRQWAVGSGQLAVGRTKSQDGVAVAVAGSLWTVSGNTIT